MVSLVSFTINIVLQQDFVLNLKVAMLYEGCTGNYLLCKINRPLSTV